MIRDAIIALLFVGGAGALVWWWLSQQDGAQAAPLAMPPDPSNGQAPEPLPPMPLPEPAVPPSLPPHVASVVQLVMQMHGPEDPALVLAMIEQESAFDPAAYNPADPNGGSWGLMQMQLPTARDMGYVGDGPGLFDPPTSIALGVAYLGWLRGYLGARGIGGDQAVIAAYNAGPGRIARVVAGLPNMGYVTAVQQRRDKWRRHLAGVLAA